MRYLFVRLDGSRFYAGADEHRPYWTIPEYPEEEPSFSPARCLSAVSVKWTTYERVWDRNGFIWYKETP
jgi:hypothetical protein